MKLSGFLNLTNIGVSNCKYPCYFVKHGKVDVLVYDEGTEQVPISLEGSYTSYIRVNGNFKPIDNIGNDSAPIFVGYQVPLILVGWGETIMYYVRALQFNEDVEVTNVVTDKTKIQTDEKFTTEKDLIKIEFNYSFINTSCDNDCDC
jgi:hypothetical protein